METHARVLFHAAKQEGAICKYVDICKYVATQILSHLYPCYGKRPKTRKKKKQKRKERNGKGKRSARNRKKDTKKQKEKKGKILANLSAER